MSTPDDVALVGFAELSATVVGARLLAVRDDRRRAGLGRRMVAWFDDLAPDRAGPDVHRPVPTRPLAR